MLGGQGIQQGTWGIVSPVEPFPGGLEPGLSLGLSLCGLEHDKPDQKHFLKGSI